jgi:exodeoxyribonuclease V alpha subunit
VSPQAKRLVLATCAAGHRAGVRRYLGSGLIKGIGPKLAEKIVDHFGVAALDVIETAPQRLVEVPTLGPKRTRLITAAW